MHDMVIPRIALTFAILLMNPAARAQERCEHAFTEAPKVSAVITAQENLLLSHLQDEHVREILSLQKAPTWHDFDALEKIQEQWAHMPDEGHSKAAEMKLRALLTLVQKPDHDYDLPTEYNLQRAYRGKLSTLLPISLKELAVKLPSSSREAQIEAHAKIIFENAKRQFDHLFPTTGFSSYAEYKRAILSSGNENLIESLKLLDAGNFDLSIRRPVNARFWVPKVGFQNQFVTGSSRGYYTPGGRNHCESGWTCTGLSDYERLLPEAKPKYGSIRPKPRYKDSYPGNLDEMYGPDIFILKKERVIERLTFNLGDSNGLLSYNTGGGWENRVNTAQAWDQAFIPWKYRGLLAPFLNRAKFGSAQDSVFPTLKKSWMLDHQYFEIQVFGELRLDDVESFQFTTEPPSGEFLRELQSHNIKIYDARKWPAKKWIP